MSAYKHDLHICAGEVGPRAELAVELIATGKGVVVVEDSLALRPNGNELLCEVIVPSPSVASRYEAAVLHARALLASSPVAAAVSGKRLAWLVVEDYGTGTTELWRAS